MKWKTTERGNKILEVDDFYISFNSFIDSYASTIEGFQSDDNSSETARCRNREYYILNGDYRAEYENLAPQGYAACYAFYKDNIDNNSSWSD